MFISFFRKHPALYLGIYLSIGSGVFFHTSIIFLLIPLFFCEKLAIWKGLLIAILSFFYAKELYQFPQIPETTGTAYFKIHTIRKHYTPFSSCMLYEGTCVSFKVDGKTTAKNLPCRVYAPFKNRPLGTCDYIIPNTTLIEITPFRYILKINKKLDWISVENTTSLSENRYGIKESIQGYLRSHYKEMRIYHLMSALATGHLEHRNLSYEFGRLGIQHVVAISGFHFALIALFLGFFLKRVFSLEIVTICLTLLITIYYFYIGNTPSINRAWIGIMMMLIGYLLNLRTTGLNVLGIALCYTALIDPIILTHLGFQLSFAATFGILTYYSIFEKILRTLLPKRNLSELLHLTTFNQYGAFFAAMIRNSLAINAAVHLTLIPILLFHFHHFPILSLMYNLFIPCCITITMLLLLLQFHTINAYYSSKILMLIASPPKIIDYHIRISSVPCPVLLMILSGICLLGIYLKEKELNDSSFKSLTAVL